MNQILMWVKVSGLALALLVTTAFYGCSEPQPTKTEIKVSISGELENVNADSIKLMRRFGMEMVLVAGLKLEKTGQNAKFKMDVKIPGAGEYYILTKLDQNGVNGLRLLLGGDTEITFKANEQNIAGTAVLNNAPFTNQYNDMLNTIEGFQFQVQQARQELQHHAQTQNQQMYTATRQRIDSLYKQQAKYVQTMATKEGLLGKVAKLYEFKPFDKNNSTYPNEEEHFKSEFLKSINFKDPTIANFPIYYERCSNYIGTLIMTYRYDFFNLDKAIQAVLKEIPLGTPAREQFLLACISTAASLQQQYLDFLDVYLTNAERYIKEFPKSDRTPIFEGDVQRFGKIRLGQPAPEIEMADVNGKPLKLSSLKGKVVLIDFWASWCGPCRKENPNVVRVYEEYNKKGFEIFSVSLDQNKDRWINAITQDRLTWPSHVSDLKGWGNEAAKAWGVSSIPATFLLDKDGRIIAKNLRGEQLEQKLQAVFK